MSRHHVSGFRRLVPLVLLTLVTACGSSGAPPPDGDGGSPGGSCGAVINSDITVPVRLINGSHDCDYLIDGDLTVQSDLIIEPGTTVEFTMDSRLLFTASGNLQAIGTASEPITLRGRQNVRGYWYGLCFDGNGPSRLEHVRLHNGGKTYNTLTLACSGAIGGITRNLAGARVDVVDSTITGSFTDGINGTRVPIGEFARNTFADNGAYGVRVHASQATNLDGATDYLGDSLGAPNGRPFVFIDGRVDTPGVTHTLRALNAPWLAGGDNGAYYRNYVRFFDGSDVVIEAGAVLLFESGSEFRVVDGSRLTAIGTPDRPVVFAGLEDRRGSWQGVKVDSAAVTLENVAVVNGGGPGLFAAGLAIYGVNTSQHSALENVLIAHTDACGLMLDSPYTDGLVQVGIMQYEDNVTDFCPAR